MQQKKTFKMLVILLVIMLTLLPFVTTFNSALTDLINKIGLYKALQNYIVPLESRLVVGVVRKIGIPAFLAPVGDPISFYLLHGKVYFPVQIQWNCLGWQSLLLLGISFIFGLGKDFSGMTKIECVAIGILGTFLINIFRMVFIVIGAYFVNSLFVFLVHDYFAALTTIVWLMFFWWFSYKYVLEQKVPFEKMGKKE
jgi:exosortase/archaeosortase family protein